MESFSQIYSEIISQMNTHGIVNAFNQSYVTENGVRILNGHFYCTKYSPKRYVFLITGMFFGQVLFMEIMYQREQVSVEFRRLQQILREFQEYQSFTMTDHVPKRLRDIAQKLMPMVDYSNDAITKTGKRPQFTFEMGTSEKNVGKLMDNPVIADRHGKMDSARISSIFLTDAMQMLDAYGFFIGNSCFHALGDDPDDYIPRWWTIAFKGQENTNGCALVSYSNDDSDGDIDSVIQSIWSGMRKRIRDSGL